MQGELLNQGLQLMLVGMGTVFAFLTVLVGATGLMSRLVLHFAPEPEQETVSEEEIAAITIAIARHRGDV